MQPLIDALSQHSALAVAAVFVAALFESVALIGVLVPGSTLVFAAGVLVGLRVLDPWAVAVAAVAGAIVGDGLSYWLGRRYHERLREMWPLRSYPDLFARGYVYFARNGGRSVFLGRFFGPLRAVVPLIAGMTDMSFVRFSVANVLSALGWAATLLLPGALFGASLQLAGAVSTRLIVLMVGVVAFVWLCVGLLRLAHRRLWPVLQRQRDRVVAWADTRKGIAPRVVQSLLDPRRPESFGLLVAALLLLGGAWIFLGVLEDVVTNDPLVQFDRVVFDALQHLRTAWVDDAMVVATELGSAAVAICVVVAVAGWLAWKRLWRTLVYWLTAVGFAQALVWLLKVTLARSRPLALYDGTGGFSFPSGHAASSIVLYGFLAFLLARGRAPAARWGIALVASVLIGLVSFSRLYLGAHWLSDVLAGLGLGTAWVALLAIAYTQHARQERLPARSLAAIALASLAISGTAVVWTQHDRDVARYAVRPASAPEALTDWSGGGWRRLQAHRTEVDGDGGEPLTLQWAGSRDRIEQALAAGGLRRPPRWLSRASLLWLLPTTPAGELPVLAKFNRGRPAAISFDLELDPARRLVVRLWHAPFTVAAPAAAGVGAGPATPLWIGMVTQERLRRPAGLLTLASTDPDPLAAARILATRLRALGIPLDWAQADGRTVLLVR